MNALLLWSESTVSDVVHHAGVDPENAVMKFALLFSLMRPKPVSACCADLRDIAGVELPT